MGNVNRITVGLLLVTIALFTVIPADAGKKPKKPQKVSREAESAYTTPAIGHPDVAVGCAGPAGCANFAIGPKERFITLEIVDATGLPVYAVAGQDLDGDGIADQAFTFCGTTDEAMPVVPDHELDVFISAAGGTMPTCVGAATSGSVRGVVSNLP